MKTWVVTLLLASIALSACEDNKDKGLGVPTTIDAIVEAQQKALSHINPATIRQGEFVYILKTQEIYSSQDPISNLIEEEGQTVTERLDFPDYFEITMVTETVNHLEEGKPHNKFKDVFAIGVAPPPPVENKPSPSILLLRQMSEPAQSLSEQDDVKISFYNLNVRPGKIAKPAKVLERDPCPADADCRLNATILSYDLVAAGPSIGVQKNKMEVWISSEVPYFASILKTCIAAVIKVETANPLVRQCSFVHDYQYTQP